MLHFYIIKIYCMLLLASQIWENVLLFSQTLFQCHFFSRVCVCRYLKASTTMPACFIFSQQSWWVVHSSTCLKSWLNILGRSQHKHVHFLHDLLGLHMWCESEKWYGVWGHIQNSELTGKLGALFIQFFWVYVKMFWHIMVTNVA